MSINIRVHREHIDIVRVRAKMCTRMFMDIVKLKVENSTEESKIEISSCKIEFSFQLGHY